MASLFPENRSRNADPNMRIFCERGSRSLPGKIA
jgi:hypothetical protein